MDIVYKVKSINIVLSFLRRELDKMYVYDYTPAKTSIHFGRTEFPLKRCAPEAAGVSSKAVCELIEALEKTDVNPHSLILLRRGRIITEAYWKPYRPDYARMLYSMSKSIVALAVGMAVNEGYFGLEDTVADLFPEYKKPIMSRRKKDISVRNLLNMSSGVYFNEICTVLDDDWVKGFAESDSAFEPGEDFFYNSMNSYMLSAIIKKTTGKGVNEFLTPRLWEPFGISLHPWELCPKGIEKGGWGVSLLPEDLAKIGVLLLNGGAWKKGLTRYQLLPEWWVREAVKEQMVPSGDFYGGNYGFQIWTGKSGSFRFNGAFGQNLYAYPARDGLAVLICGNASLFGSGEGTDLINGFFDDDANFVKKTLMPNGYSRRLKRMELYCGRVYNSEEVNAELQNQGAFPLDGKEFEFERNFAGILPFIQQTFHNNYARGISKARIYREGKILILELTEGGDVNRLRVGLGEYAYCDVSVKGERYRVGAIGRFDRPGPATVLTIRAAFIETPNRRQIQVSFHDGKMTLRFDEEPSVEQGVKLLSQLTGGSSRFDAMLNLAMKNQQLHSVAMELAKPEITSV